MHIRMLTFQIQSGKLDDAIALYKSIEHEWKQQNGFVRAHLLADRNTGKSISVTVWDTLADLEATESSGWYQDVVGRFGSLFASPPTREIFEEVVTI